MTRTTLHTSSLRIRPAFGLALALFLAPSVAAEESDIAQAGDVLEFALPAAALVATALNRDGEGSRQMVLGALTNLAVTYALKESISKGRPDDNDNQSFPSAHTSVSFQAARFTHKRYGRKWGVPMYVAASFVGYSRIEDDRHDEWDVLAGAAIGILAAEMFTTRFKGADVQPIVAPGYAGVHLRMEF